MSEKLYKIFQINEGLPLIFTVTYVAKKLKLNLDRFSQGRLSPRMMISNNPWSSAWASAQPVPAHRQKRLFDDTREAEKAIHYLTSQRLGQIAQLLLPVLMHAGLSTLNSQKQEALTNLADVVQSILNKLQYATKPIHQKIKSYEVFLLADEIFIDVRFISCSTNFKNKTLLFLGNRARY